MRPCRRRRVRSQPAPGRSEEHTSELQSLAYLVCRLLLEKKKKQRWKDVRCERTRRVEAVTKSRLTGHMGVHEQGTAEGECAETLVETPRELSRSCQSGLV